MKLDNVTGSQMERLLKSTDWSQTTLDAYQSWPNQLRSALLSCFASRLPAAIYWGKEFHLFYNDGYVPVAGFKHPNSFGQPGAKVWNEIWKDIGLEFEQVVETRTGLALNNQMLLMDRFGQPEEAFFNYTLSPILDGKGNVLGIHNTAIEITDRVRAEKEREASLVQVNDAKSQLIGVLENMNDAYFAVDKNWIMTDVNRAHEIASKQSRESQIGKSFLDLFLSSEAAKETQYWKQYHRAMNERVAISFEEYYSPLELWTLVNAYPTADGRLAVFFKDITSIKKLNLQLEQTQSELEQAVDIAQIGFWSVEPSGRALHVSDNFLRHFGITRKTFGGSLETGLANIHSEDRDRVAKALTSAMNSNVGYHNEYRVVHPGGEIRWIEAKGKNTFDRLRGKLRFTGTTMDITERIRATEALEAAKTEAERANHLKSAFLANMSHEIRTPLGAMIGFAELLGDPGTTPAERANYIEILQKNGSQLGHVINDILDLSKVETGHISFEYLQVNPMVVAHEVISLMNVLAKEKELVLSFQNDGTAPETVIADPTRVKQVLTNLVSNALKFTKVGSILISLSGYEGLRGEKCCAFEVTDTGLGIPAQSTQRLFKMFTQADNSMTRKYGGTGLGLALSRALARAMGGNVRLVKSEENVGSTFHFSVESRGDLFESGLRGDEQKTEFLDVPLREEALKNVRILLVEDSPDNQQLIWRYLSKYGACVEIAENGAEGLSMALANEHDIVLMDLQMPVMDGYTAIGKLRARGYKTPMIALTAHAMADVKKKCEDLGFNDHLPKPINVRDLVHSIVRLARA